LSFLKPVGLEKPEFREKYLASVLKAVLSQTQPHKLEALWAASDIDIEQFVDKDRIDAFVENTVCIKVTNFSRSSKFSIHDFQNIQGYTFITCMSPDAYFNELIVLLSMDSKNNEHISNWIDVRDYEKVQNKQSMKMFFIILENCGKEKIRKRICPSSCVCYGYSRS